MASELAVSMMAQISGPPNLETFIESHLFNGVNVAFTLVGFALVGMLIYGGFMRMMSGENPQQIAKANGIIFWAIVGAILVLSSVFIVNFLGQILGRSGLDVVDIPSPPSP